MPSSPGSKPWKYHKAGVGDNHVQLQLWGFSIVCWEKAAETELHGLQGSLSMQHASGRQLAVSPLIFALWQLPSYKRQRETAGWDAATDSWQGEQTGRRAKQQLALTSEKQEYKCTLRQSKAKLPQPGNSYNTMMLQWFFFSGRANFSSVYLCESIQFPNKQKVISSPPIPCVSPLSHKSAPLQLALSTSLLTAVSR